METILAKWYDTLFGDRYDRRDFEELLKNTDLRSCRLEDYPSGDAERDLLTVLYGCETLERAFAARGIPQEILMDTLSDIPLWSEVYRRLSGKLGIAEAAWFRHAHFSGRFFKLGRLQFLVNEKETEVHIPACGPFPPSLCEDSFKKADAFRKKFYPDRASDPYTCHSWLLDDTLQQFLPPDANILRFAARFTPKEKQESDAALRYLFTWDTTRENLADALPTSSLASRVKDYVLGGGKLYETLGVIERPTGKEGSF